MSNHPLVQTNASLQSHNMFGVDVTADFFAVVTDEEQLREVVLAHADVPLLFLGGGSNILFTKDFAGLVIHLDLQGITTVYEDEETIHLEIGAGENWHSFVEFCVRNGYGGVENLALIPGTVGAAPVQNIGAYGRELKDVFVSCDVFDTSTNSIQTISKDAAEFGYRMSIFKKQPMGASAVLRVTLALTKKNHQLSTHYGAIQEMLDEKNISDPTIADVAEAVVAIRSAKLPDPKVLGNNGSFFKNPIVDEKRYQDLLERYPDIPAYKQTETQYKIPAGWLVEKAGLRGYRQGDVGTYPKQALVIVNYGTATGAEIWKFAQYIQSEVFRLFSIQLDPEVRIL